MLLLTAMLGADATKDEKGRSPNLTTQCFAFIRMSPVEVVKGEMYGWFCSLAHGIRTTLPSGGLLAG